MFFYEYELTKVSNVLVREIFKLKPGETFIITADTGTDYRIVNVTASAAFAVDAKPMVIWLASPLGVGKAADPILPVKALAGALKEADAWVAFNNKFLLYSTPYEIAMKENKKLRYMGFAGYSTDTMIRLIGQVDYPTLKEFLENISDKTKNAKHIRMTTPAGVDIEFDNAKLENGNPDPTHPIHVSFGYADVPGAHMVAGQISWSPNLESIHGIIAIDNSITKIGKLEEPIFLTIKAGTIINVEGGEQAVELEAWLRSFNHPHMYKIAHTGYGFNPGAKFGTGLAAEDERIWGSTEWGIGHVGAQLIKPDGISAPSHIDGKCLNTSVWLDGEQIMNNGKIIEPSLVKLAEKLGKG